VIAYAYAQVHKSALCLFPPLLQEFYFHLVVHTSFNTVLPARLDMSCLPPHTLSGFALQHKCVDTSLHMYLFQNAEQASIGMAWHIQIYFHTLFVDDEEEPAQHSQVAREKSPSAIML